MGTHTPPQISTRMSKICKCRTSNLSETKYTNTTISRLGNILNFLRTDNTYSYPNSSKFIYLFGILNEI